MIDGLKIINKENYTLVVVENFSEELKESIRKNLSAICNGEKKADLGRELYRYETTIKKFFQRLKTKNTNTKIGMIGELLVHLMMGEVIEDFSTVSPFFNTDTKSIRHGFDIINYKKENGTVWITEVKSGRKSNMPANTLMNELINRGKRDLVTRLNEKNDVLWDNAINSVDNALSDSKNIKETIMKILEGYNMDAMSDSLSSNEVNVILAGCLFASLSDEVTEDYLKKKHAKLSSKNDFNDLYIIAIQKKTYEKIYQFIKSEANE